PASLDLLEQIDEVVGAVRLARITGMLVLLADRLDEADRLQIAVVLRRGLREVLEVHLVLQVRASGRTRCEVGEVVERLMVVLEQRVRAARPVRDGHAGPYARVD